MKAHAHPVRRQVLLFQQMFDGLNPVQILHGILPPIGMSAGWFQKVIKGFFPVTQGRFADSSKLGNLIDSEH